MRWTHQPKTGRQTGSASKKGWGMSRGVFTFWMLAAVVALHLANPTQTMRMAAPTATNLDAALSLTANDHPNLPYADLRNAVQVLGTESRSLLTKSTSQFPGFDDPVGQSPCGSICMAFGDAANAPPAEASPPAAIVARAFQPRAPPSLLA